MNTTNLYLLTTAVNLSGWINIVIIMSCVCFFGALAVKMINADGCPDDDISKITTKYLKMSVCVFIVSGFITSLVPSERQLALIFAASYITTGDLGKELKNIPPTAAKYINSYIEKQLEDMVPEKKEAQ